MMSSLISSISHGLQRADNNKNRLKKHGSCIAYCFEQNDVQQRLDETMYLRETLDRTKDRLHQEKRLNDNIKKKKTFHLENEKGPFVTNRSHACPPDDLLAKVLFHI